ncbi:MAG TPA: cyclic nucleotide-binding domain-containing protein [Gaiellaceae bacterium]|nr:cyclic nucleotide-binding domain-containing protein [Gaiellaceae bacterium]
MRIESSVISVTWIPSEAIEGMPKLPFELGVAHYDEPPPDTLGNLDKLHDADAFREANELRAWIEVKGGRIVDYGHEGRGLIGVTRIKLGPGRLAFPAVAFPLIQPEPEVGDGWVRFVQTAGGRMGLPAPRRVRGKPYFQFASASAWTTLQLILYADGRSKGSLVGASPFPRHWVYDDENRLVEKSGTIDFEKWYRESYGEKTPWGGEDTPAFVTAVETELERALSESVMKIYDKLPRRSLGAGETLIEQGAEGDDLYVLLDGVLDVEVDGETVAEVGPGAILGERAAVEGGPRTATLRAVTPCRVVVLESERISKYELTELALSRRREET